MRILSGLLTGVLVASVLALLPTSAAQAEVCQHRTGVNHDGGIFPNPFTEDSICGNQAQAPVRATPDGGSPQVGILDSTRSWFLCWARGQQHSGGNNVWYYTQGDRVVSDPGRRGYGFVPASHLNTSVDPGDARLSECPPIPSGRATAYMVYDRTTGASTRSDEHKQFRSASLVKLLIALDYLEARGPGASIPAADAQLLQTMLRSSDDTAATTLWTRNGYNAIVNRMVTKIGLVDTTPPANQNIWGYTAVSAADVVTTYRYILERAHPTFRDLIMGHLRLATRCASDGWDQYFGIPSAIPRPWAVKQGWSGFSLNPPPGQECQAQTGRTGNASEDGRADGASTDDRAGDASQAANAAGPDLSGVAMHTSGTFCANDRKIMVVLTLNPAGTTWSDAGGRLTTQAGDLYRAVGC
ncbi:hypothetical protein [Streptosporangium carneum]|uniref:Serine hydrolase n=1 Tax=Streptosporangium carneum TaxID=47481 RepID=A0A9W6I0X6_9ACTN|nr:hypothetical protein [Streptosporangium carneum]GLK09652.1 hypothetical protein GCM10017600_30580 [Streptosporangium carneum]